jgi:putative hemolysin
VNWLSQWIVALPLAALCVIVSGFCSGSEVALFSLRRVDREQLARSESSIDRRILKLLERPRRLIATVLIGNEAFNSFLAVLALIVVIHFAAARELSPWAIGGIALGVTLPLIVLVAEVTSKTIAAKAPLTWARICVLPLTAFAVVVTPLRLVVNFLAEVLLRPLGDAARTRPARDLSEQEFKSLVDAGSAQGQVDARERRLIHRVFEFSDKNVGQVMTPRDRIFALSYDLPNQRLAKEIAARGFSRVPIYQKSLDNVRGILNAKDLVSIATGQAPARPLNELLHEPLFVPRTTPVKRLFLTFKQKKVHMAIVVSEYGKVLGIVTMDDLLAQIFGVIRDERAALQASSANIKVQRPRTPGGPVTPPLPHPLDTGPVTKDESQHLETPPGEPVPGEANEPARAMPRPSRPAIRPVHPDDEVTPPAIDVDELRAQEKRGTR